jgi:hypothetical protein
MKHWLLALVAMLAAATPAAAQFRDDFDRVKTDPAGKTGWRFRTGDGKATMQVRQGGKGYASLLVDATADRRGIWWALFNREVSKEMDLGRLEKPGHEVRIEARIRVSHAPRRVNLQIQTQRTTDYHSHLMEYDIPQAETWHTISMTTHGFDAGPGDTLIGHMAIFDWGLAKYRVDVDYVQVDIVESATAGPDLGGPIPYHPPIADPKSFAHEVPVIADGMLDLVNTDVNLNDWTMRDGDRKVRVLTVDGTHHAILRWDLKAFAGQTVAASGLLELTTHSVARKAEDVPDFGLLRVVEILGGDPAWDPSTVTTDSFRRGAALQQVLNTQMVIDGAAAPGDGAKTYLTIPVPVLQRLVDGKTYGLAIQALGALSASVYALENDDGGNGARLRFNVN